MRKWSLCKETKLLEISSLTTEFALYDGVHDNLLLRSRDIEIDPQFVDHEVIERFIGPARSPSRVLAVSRQPRQRIGDRGGSIAWITDPYLILVRDQIQALIETSLHILLIHLAPL